MRGALSRMRMRRRRLRRALPASITDAQPVRRCSEQNPGVSWTTEDLHHSLAPARDLVRAIKDDDGATFLSILDQRSLDVDAPVDGKPAICVAAELAAADSSRRWYVETLEERGASTEHVDKNHAFMCGFRL